MRKGNSKLLIRNLRKQADKKQLNIGGVSVSLPSVDDAELKTPVEWIEEYNQLIDSTKV